MKNGFKIIREGGEISIVRERVANSKNNSYPVQRIKVMCFDSAQVDRIFSIQENSAKTTLKR